MMDLNRKERTFGRCAAKGVTLALAGAALCAALAVGPVNLAAAAKTDAIEGVGSFLVYNADETKASVVKTSAATRDAAAQNELMRMLKVQQALASHRIGPCIPNRG